MREAGALSGIWGSFAAFYVLQFVTPGQRKEEEDNSVDPREALAKATFEAVLPTVKVLDRGVADAIFANDVVTMAKIRSTGRKPGFNRRVKNSAKAG